MNRRLPWVLCALLLLVTVVWRAPLPAGAPAMVIKACARPLALPFLWRALDRAQGRGDRTEEAARGQLIAALLPEWADGQVHFAWLLAQSPTEDPAQRMDQLLAALSVLEDARTPCREREDQILAAMSLLVQVLAENDPDVSELLHSSIGSTPRELAVHYLDEAVLVSPSPALEETRLFLSIGLVGTFLRRADKPRARAVIDAFLDRLPAVRDPELRELWGPAVRALRTWLVDGREESREALERHRVLTDLLAGLPLVEDGE